VRQQEEQDFPGAWQSVAAPDVVVRVKVETAFAQLVNSKAQTGYYQQRSYLKTFKEMEWGSFAVSFIVIFQGFAGWRLPPLPRLPVDLTCRMLV
jgi:hypothetical protein